MVPELCFRLPSGRLGCCPDPPPQAGGKTTRPLPGDECYCAMKVNVPAGIVEGFAV